MNIFYLHEIPRECAKMHTNKHVVKMILEYAQLLSTAHRVLDGDIGKEAMYKATHKNHPSAVWVRQSIKHYQHLFFLLEALCIEYTFRYEKVHKVERSDLLNLLAVPPNALLHNQHEATFTPPPQAMPDDYKDSDTIRAYRTYYMKGKSHLAQWKKRDIPSWFTPLN